VNLDDKTGCRWHRSSAPLGLRPVRFFLGLAEAGNFPPPSRRSPEWFPKKERAFATGIFNSGSNVGALLTPIAVPWITLHWGMEAAFIATGALGFLWLAFWLFFYREPEKHPRLSEPSSPTSAATRPSRRPRSRGPASSATGRPGPSPSASS
jgi:MFS family permease